MRGSIYFMAEVRFQQHIIIRLHPQEGGKPCTQEKGIWCLSIPVLVTEFSILVFAKFNGVKKKKKNWAVSQEKELCKYI